MEQRWIPVAERLPEDGTYLTTLDGELVGQEEPFTGMCGIENGKWDEDGCVIAWMPLPEPYKESEDMERNCEHYAPMTNADRIRSMTDEELAEWFNTVTKDVLGGSTWNKKGWLKWLRAESEE